MNGFECLTEEISKRGKAVTDTGDAVAGVDLAGELAGVPAALPGSDAAGAAGTLADAWTSCVSHLARRTRSHGSALCEAAAEYERCEQSAVDSLDALLWNRAPAA